MKTFFRNTFIWIAAGGLGVVILTAALAAWMPVPVPLSFWAWFWSGFYAYAVLTQFRAVSAFATDLVKAMTTSVTLLDDVNPVQPDKPTGLGAVVEVDGQRYTRSARRYGNAVWVDGHGSTYLTWDHILRESDLKNAPVKILSEGVQL